MKYAIYFLIFFCSCNHSSTDWNNPIEFQNLFSADLNEEVSCYRIPSLLKAANGDLIAAIDERVPSCGDLKWSEDINIVAKRSLDQGKTWTEVERLVDYPLGQSASDPSMILDKETNRIFLFYNFMDLRNEKDVYYLKIITSDDHGKSWSQPIDITDQITKPEWKTDFKFITSGKGIQTKDGRLLHTIVNIENGLHVFGSNDHGKSWYLIDTPIQPGDESKILERSDGSWMINSRVAKAGIRYVHVSEDDGNNWKTKKETALIDPACNASFIRYTSTKDGYKKNRLLFLNANDSTERSKLTLHLSYDEGETWPIKKTIYPGKAAYSSLCVLEDRDIGMFFEKDDYKENVFTSVSLEWLTDGKDKCISPPQN